jgi:hypothetical protein
MSGFAKSLPAALALLLLAAHFFRAGRLAAVVGALLLLAVLCARRVWAVRLVQASLAVGIVVWLHTAAVFAAERRAAGAPSTRLWLILGGVATFTALAIWMLESRARELGFRT